MTLIIADWRAVDIGAEWSRPNRVSVRFPQRRSISEMIFRSGAAGEVARGGIRSTGPGRWKVPFVRWVAAAGVEVGSPPAIRLDR